MKLNFLKPTSLLFGYDYYAPARMVVSQLNRQIILLLKRSIIIDIDRDGHEISRFGGLPRQLILQPFKLNFLKPTSFSFVYDYYASARMVASQLNRQIILLLKRSIMIDIDQDGHEISRFGGLPRQLYFPKGLYFPEVRSTEGKYCPEGKYNCLGTTDTGRYLLY